MKKFSNPNYSNFIESPLIFNSFKCSDFCPFRDYFPSKKSHYCRKRFKEVNNEYLCNFKEFEIFIEELRASAYDRCKR